ncbi:MAG TPA: hypothetical protein VEY88_06690, partial [Archangium sp.]|nr:hypothetical protein [Archangium sp.]
MNLLKGVFGTSRNPAAHVPRILWQVSEQDALTCDARLVPAQATRRRYKDTKVSAMSKMMRLLQVVVGKHGYRNPAGNSSRNELLGEILRLADKSGAAGVVLPAGFWTVDDPSKVLLFAKSIQKRIGRCGIAVIAGIDVAMSDEVRLGKRRPTSRTASKKDPGIRSSSLPYHGFAIASSGALVGPFQQESRTAEDASDARPLDP